MRSTLFAKVSSRTVDSGYETFATFLIISRAQSRAQSTRKLYMSPLCITTEQERQSDERRPRRDGA